VVFIAWKGFRTGLRYSAVLLLVEYIFLLFCSTVFFRTLGDTRQYDFHPFWSYSRPDLFVENLMNVIVFIPIGMILGSLLRGKGSWLIALAVGMGISASIEAMQYFFHRGFAETDDVMHNTIGCIAGYMLVNVSRFIVKGVKNCRI
jgi:glycopeptide antibiotics resistance protein